MKVDKYYEKKEKENEMNRSERTREEEEKKIVFIAKNLLTSDFRTMHSYLYLLMIQNFVAKKQK